jgi:glutaredoxin
VKREVTLYTRMNCGLCDEAAAKLRGLERRLMFKLVEVDVDSDPHLRERYDALVPVVVVDGREIARAPMPAKLERLLADALREG